MPTLDAVHALLCAASGTSPDNFASEADFFSGDREIQRRADRILGRLSPHGPVRLLVTMPTAAGEDPSFARRLAELGVEAVRINSAHDDEETWSRMVDNVARAARETGWQMKLIVDLAGPKIRTGKVRLPAGLKRVRLGMELSICVPQHLHCTPGSLAAIECTMATALMAMEPGHRVFVDDGQLALSVKRCEDWGVVAEVHGCSKEKGYKLKPEKGLNFPDTNFSIPALSDTDRTTLGFAAHQADAIGYSFVQSHEDVAALQSALADIRPAGWRELGLVLKIETQRAIRNLPDMLVRAAGVQPTAVMIARGDLAVEIGFARLAEMQEEILWLCEAAHIPIVWATQVLESYVKSGLPSRGEMTDAAMAARAECVMLNKGPHIFEVISNLDRLMGRMNEHYRKKTPMLRPLRSW